MVRLLWTLLDPYGLCRFGHHYCVPLLHVYTTFPGRKTPNSLATLNNLKIAVMSVRWEYYYSSPAHPPVSPFVFILYQCNIWQLNHTSCRYKFSKLLQLSLFENLQHKLLTASPLLPSTLLISGSVTQTRPVVQWASHISRWSWWKLYRHGQLKRAARPLCMPLLQDLSRMGCTLVIAIFESKPFLTEKMF